MVWGFGVELNCNWLWQLNCKSVTSWELVLEFTHDIQTLMWVKGAVIFDWRLCHLQHFGCQIFGILFLKPHPSLMGIWSLPGHLLLLQFTSLVISKHLVIIHVYLFLCSHFSKKSYYIYLLYIANRLCIVWPMLIVTCSSFSQCFTRIMLLLVAASLIFKRQNTCRSQHWYYVLPLWVHN
jgi:hypothetical protein